MPSRTPSTTTAALAWLACSLPLFGQSYQEEIRPFLQKYCVACHSGDDPAGDADFTAMKSGDEVTAAFELWSKADDLLSRHKMPPDDEPQPSHQERLVYRQWYRHTFVDAVEARPGAFRPRRLSATEYRNTFRSLFGFDLEVAVIEAEQTIAEKSLVLKLLPTDPPGKSGFRNDTYSNPLNTQTWELYSYLVDFALEELFSSGRRAQLGRLAGEMPKGDFTFLHAETLLRRFIPKAWRRTVPEQQLAEIAGAVRHEPDLIAATQRELKAALMSPAFMYRGLLMPREPGLQQPVDVFELAERLSYFIWADMPDDELGRLASEGILDESLHQQVDRMLDSPRAENLATDFAMQWLALHEIDHVSDNPPYREALKSQAIDFFKYLFAEDRSLMELIDSDTTFVNPLTRKFYLPDTDQMGRYRKPKGIEIEIVPNTRITLEQTLGRGGLLTMPGVLAMNRGPILRGVWMLERIMGEHLPDPPANVGQVEASIPGEELSFRQRFAQHREEASCAICHDKIDPLGFSLEAYDDAGRFLFAKDNSRKRPKRRQTVVEDIDTTGQLPSGERFADFAELKQILLTSQREPIVRNIVKQLLAYALCRQLELYDQPTVDAIVTEMLSQDGTWRDLVHAIVSSLPFRETYVPGAQP